MRKYMGYYDSSNGVNRVAYYVCEPDAEPRCIVQLAHGMCENAALYKRLMNFLAARGCVVCANDFLGHGRSVRDFNDVGFFSAKNGWRCIIRDMKILTDIISERYRELPLILVGHSMGSFAVREYLTWYGDILSGCVLVGTSDGFESRKALLNLARLMCLYEGGRYHAPLVMKMGCGFFCRKMGKCSFGWDWVSRDRNVRELMDRHSFDYTARAYYDIITMLDVISAPDWAYSVPPDLPILMMSGSRDAVGNCGKGVARLYRRLKRAGIENIKVRLYYGARHMLLHETNRIKVYGDLYEWINSVINKEKL